MRKNRPDVRSHIVGAFDGVTEVFAGFGHQAFEEVAEIEGYVRVGVLLNDERGGGVLDEEGQEAIAEVLFREPVLDIVRERVEAFAAGWNGHGSMTNHISSLAYRKLV